MICFEIILNRRRLCVAGVGDSGVLSTIISWVGGSPAAPSKRGRTRAGDAQLHVGGLYNPEPHVNVHPRWINKRLKAGDEVTVRVIKCNHPDIAKEKTIQTDDDIREQQRQYYLSVKEQFEPSEHSARAKPKSHPRKARKI